ncbi:MarR family transcriptional regulator, partial [Streptomyces sp. NPDC057900]|uniref:MarR family transcriptional regulator n=1 Tax=Streptomyces sp. NPDC057900 TaxID=3346274 RepID=UPI0036E0462B
PEAERPALRLIKDEAAVTAPAAEPVTNRSRVLGAVAAGARTNRDIVDRTEINKGSVSKLVKALLETGDLVKDPDAGLILGTNGDAAVSA